MESVATEGRLGLPRERAENSMAANGHASLHRPAATEFALGGEAFTRGLLGIG